MRHTLGFHFPRLRHDARGLVRPDRPMLRAAAWWSAGMAAGLALAWLACLVRLG